MYTPYVRVLPFVCALAFCGALEVQAHDLPGLVVERNALEPEVRAKLDEIRALRQLLATRSAANPQEGQLEAVVRTALKWPNSKASVCFFDGRQEARDHVVEVAQMWSKSTGLQFDFGPAGNRRTCDQAKPSDIRVSFRGSGNWSYIGIEARHINPLKQTLNLQGMDKTSFTAHDDFLILHEFGHAIGFEHEHQSPVAGCEEEFNWNFLYTAMGWSKEEVDRNMQRFSTPSSKSGLLTTDFDRQSVMLYSLSPEAFKNPDTAKCFIPQPNNVLSTLDQQAAATVYPVAGQPSPPAAPPAAPTTPDAVAAVRAMQRLGELSAPAKGQGMGAPRP